MPTRPETLIRQLVDQALAPLLAEERVARTKIYPPPPVTPEVRRLHREYLRVVKRSEQLRQAITRAGGNYYGSQPTMQGDSRVKQQALDRLAKAIARIKGLKQQAMLGVLGLGAVEARPVVLKLQQELRRRG